MALVQHCSRSTAVETLILLLVLIMPPGSAVQAQSRLNQGDGELISTRIIRSQAGPFMIQTRRIHVVARRRFQLHGKVEAIFDFDAMLAGNLPDGLSSEVVQLDPSEPIATRLDTRESILELERCAAAGFAILSGPSATRKITQLYGGKAEGLLVGYVDPKSSAAAAGLKSDDLLLDVLEVVPADGGADQQHGDCSRLTVRVISPRGDRLGRQVIDPRAQVRF